MGHEEAEEVPTVVVPTAAEPALLTALEPHHEDKLNRPDACCSVLAIFALLREEWSTGHPSPEWSTGHPPSGDEPAAVLLRFMVAVPGFSES
jgi:hypothetical protein